MAYFDKICIVFLDPVAPVDVALTPGNNVKLPCELHSNLAHVVWQLNHQPLHSDGKYLIYSGGLLILDSSQSDTGLYICDSVEQINGRTHIRTMAVYNLQRHTDFGEATTPASKTTTDFSLFLSTTMPEIGIVEPLTPGNQKDQGKMSSLEVAVALLTLLCLALLGVILYIWVRGHLECLKTTQASSQNEMKRQSAEYVHIPNRTSEVKLLGPEPGTPCISNNNHCTVDFKQNGVHRITSLSNISSLNGLGYINDESEI